MNDQKNFQTSIKTFIYSTGKMTYINPEEMNAQYLIDSDELNEFIRNGNSDINKVDVSIQPTNTNSESRNIS